MEFLNKIELRGIVGQSSLNRVGDSQVCRFSLVTEYSYKDRGNNPVVDVTWFNITAWEGKNMPELHLIGKGVIVQVAGRVRTVCSIFNSSLVFRFLELNKKRAFAMIAFSACFCILNEKGKMKESIKSIISIMRGFLNSPSTCYSFPSS